MNKIKFKLTESQKLGLKDLLVANSIEKPWEEWIYDYLVKYVVSTQEELLAIESGDTLTNSITGEKIIVAPEEIEAVKLTHSEELEGMGSLCILGCSQRLYDSLVKIWKYRQVVGRKTGLNKPPHFEQFLNTIIRERVNKMLAADLEKQLYEEKKDIFKPIKEEPSND